MRVKVGRPTGELVASKSGECDAFSCQCSDTGGYGTKRAYSDLDLVPPMPVGTLGSSLTPETLDVLFFACHRLESTTLQPSKVDGLVDAVCGLPSGIYALLQYLPIFLNQFSAGLLRLLYVVPICDMCKILCRHS